MCLLRTGFKENVLGMETHNPMGSLLTNTIIIYFWVEKANDCNAHLHFLPNCTFVKTLQKRQSFLTTPNRCPPTKHKIKNALTNYTTDKEPRQ